MRNLSVLVIEESDAEGEIVAQILKGLGVNRVAQFRGAEAGLAHLSREAVDLVIVAAVLPGLDGYAFTSRLRLSRHMPGRAAPVILLTTQTRLADVALARDSGVTWVVAKPVTQKTLFKAMSVLAQDDRHRVGSRRGRPTPGSARIATEWKSEGPNPGSAVAPGNMSQAEIDALLMPATV
ncbi:response regulator [Muricoccus radiodurans]|uniref:response regulator n=1 Tax=Muricoccus radiodurans TaxID=2231721 RepID=UPI003CF37037